MMFVANAARTLVLLLACAALMPALTPFAKAAETADRNERERNYFSDTVLLDQDGRQRRFFTDTLMGQTVLINFMFASCAGACPIIVQRLIKAREILNGAGAGKIRFVSITVDPGSDTPEELRKYAAKFSISTENWTFLTGNPKAVNAVLQKLGERAREPEAHTSILLAGNVSSRRWRKLRPDATPEAIASVLREFSATSP